MQYARLMTELHAQPAKRPMPLATASAANADGAASSSGGDGAAGAGSPAVKKPKAAASKQLNPALSKSKKSLKRL
jgi:hypothetical protein